MWHHRAAPRLKVGNHINPTRAQDGRVVRRTRLNRIKTACRVELRCQQAHLTCQYSRLTTSVSVSSKCKVIPTPSPQRRSRERREWGTRTTQARRPTLSELKRCQTMVKRRTMFPRNIPAEEEETESRRDFTRSSIKKLNIYILNIYTFYCDIIYRHACTKSFSFV